jgi:predicted acyltransferase
MPAETNQTKPVAVPLSRPPSPRVDSVDTLRGLIIALMIFVNDVAGVRHAPGWLKHATAQEDAMTLPDIVFPCFLFMVGVSVPLALDRARAAGASTAELFLKILGRTGVLLTMGVLMVNMEEYSPWPRGAWGALAYLAMFLAFAVVPPKPGPFRSPLVIGRRIGGLALVGLALAYTNEHGQHLLLGPLFDPTDTLWLRHSWWGILGLIGWAYLVSATLYLIIGRRREWLVGATGLLMLLYVADRANIATRLANREWLDGARPLTAVLLNFFGWINSHVSFGEALGSLAAIAMAGCCLGSILVPRSEVNTERERLRWAAVFGAGLLIAVLLFDPVYGLNKINATPAWCFLCAAIATFGWIFLYWWMDVRSHRAWSSVLRPAGANPLLAYLLHPFLYAVAGLTGLRIDFYRSPDWPLAINLVGCLLMALLVVRLTGLIARAGFRIKA